MESIISSQKFSDEVHPCTYYINMQVLAIVKDTKSLRNIEDIKSQAGPLEK